MMIRKSKDIVMHELIGLKLRIEESSDSTIIGLSGKIIGETKNTIILESNKRIKKIIKGICVFRITIPESGDDVIVSGSDIIGRPENRIKKWK